MSRRRQVDQDVQSEHVDAAVRQVILTVIP